MCSALSHRTFLVDASLLALVEKQITILYMNTLRRLVIDYDYTKELQLAEITIEKLGSYREKAREPLK